MTDDSNVTPIAPPDKPKRGQRGKGKSTEPAAPAEQALDNAEVAKAIKVHVALVAAKGAARKVINGEISTSRTGLVDRGMNRQALAMVEKVAKMEDSHRHNFNLTLLLGLKAIAQPLQRELFDSIYPAPPEEEAPNEPDGATTKH